MIETITVSTPELGDRSYLLHDGHVGVVIDPQRDSDRLLRAAAAANVRIACIAETHIHNDYVSGGSALAQHLAVPYLVAADEEVSFPRRPVRDGEEIKFGQFSLRVLATPGHTPHHLSYVALDQGRPILVCTGGSLLFGSVGRTDLLGPSLAAALGRQQYRSAHEIGRLPGSVEVLPTHGFGSFCSVGASGTENSTIAEQRIANLAFQAADEDGFVERILSVPLATPHYYRRMAGVNRKGAPLPDLVSPPRLDGVQLCEMLASNAWVVDMRARGTFAGSHLSGTINVEHDLPFTTYLGWLRPDDAPLVLLGETAKTIAAAQVDLSRIGIDQFAGQHVGPLPPAGLEEHAGSYPVRGFAELTEALLDPRQVALDVRRSDEWEAGHLDAAIHIPLHELEDRMGELPPGTVWVHCAAGYRAAIGASLLARKGRDVVLVDGRFDGP